ncbi:MAG: hypothetical protein WAJ92_05310, partial [Candidatus Acidiferrales bacterium]
MIRIPRAVYLWVSQAGEGIYGSPVIDSHTVTLLSKGVPDTIQNRGRSRILMQRTRLKQACYDKIIDRICAHLAERITPG